MHHCHEQFSQQVHWLVYVYKTSIKTPDRQQLLTSRRSFGAVLPHVAISKQEAQLTDRAARDVTHILSNVTQFFDKSHLMAFYLGKWTSWSFKVIGNGTIQ